MVDILIAGGGIAGSSLAILLGRQGFTVELYEKCRFPREKTCGEGLMPAGVAALERLGLADAVGGEPFVGVRYHSGVETVEGRFPKLSGLPETGRGQRRFFLDQVLFAAAARTASVRTHTGACVSAPLMERGRVSGLVVDGVPHRARLVVAADGANSRLRHHLGLVLPPRTKRFGIRMHFRLASPVEAMPWVEVFLGNGYELYVTPLPRNEMAVVALSYARSLALPLEEQFRRWCREHPCLSERLRTAEKISDIRTASLGEQARCGVVPGIVLLGDATGSSDPITGSGMTQALLSSELLAAELKEGIPRDEDWLWRFERRRKSMLGDSQRLARLALVLAGRPRVAHLFLLLLRARPKLLSHLLAVSSGAERLFGRLDFQARGQYRRNIEMLLSKPIARACGGSR